MVDHLSPLAKALRDAYVESTETGAVLWEYLAGVACNHAPAAT